MRNAYIFFVWKPQGKRALGRHGTRWENNVKTDLKEMRYEGVDYIQLA